MKEMSLLVLMVLSESQYAAAADPVVPGRPDKTIVIFGRTGAGKSTLANALISCLLGDFDKKVIVDWPNSSLAGVLDHGYLDS